MKSIQVYPGAKKRNAIPIQLVDDTEVYLFPAAKEDFSLAVKGLPLLSEESLHMRFMGREHEDPEHLLAHLLLIDQKSYFAWGALAPSRPDLPGLGMCHLIRFPKIPNQAEFALTVIDEYQHKGLGKFFLALLYTIALKHQITTMIGYVLHENQSFIRMLKKLGGCIEHEDDIAIVKLTTDFEMTDIPITPYGKRFREKIYYMEKELGLLSDK